MNKQETAKKIYEKAHITGSFTLRSGQVSEEYFDKYLFESDPGLLSEITDYMSTLIPQDTEVLAGLEIGGIPIATSLSLKTGILCAFVRKKAKEYGTCKLAEGADIKDKKICVVEDVVTTGGQIIESVKELRKRGAIVEAVLCVILRDNKAVDKLSDQGLKLIAAYTMDELKR